MNGILATQIFVSYISQSCLNKSGNMEFVMGLALALPITSATGVSVVTGVAQGVSEQKKQNADASNQTRMLKFHIDVVVDPKARKGIGAGVHDTIITLRDDKVWLETKSKITRLPENVAHHPFTGFYLAYPDDSRPHTRGLVSTISVDPPVLNWIYIDKDTFECKYATRTGSIAHHVGSYDWTTDEGEDSRITFDEFEGFMAVEESPGEWALYFDIDDNGLKEKRKRRNAVEISLQRRVISEQETNQWGLAGEGNIGFKKTREV